MILFTNSFQGHLQGYPLGLQLVVGLIDYQPGDPLSLLRWNLEDLAEKLSGQIDPYLMEVTFYTTQLSSLFPGSLEHNHRETCKAPVCLWGFRPVLYHGLLRPGENAT